MFKQILIIATLACLTGLIGVANLVKNEYSVKIYDKINEHLEKELKNDERVEQNLDEAIEWLVTRGTSEGCFLSSFKSYKPALKQLKALRDGIQCDQSGYEMLMSIAEATRYRANWRPSYMKSTRRIDKIINQLFVQHARGCHQTYVARFRSKIDQLSDKTKAQNVLDIAMGKVFAYAKYIMLQTNTTQWSKCDLDTLKDHFNSYPNAIRALDVVFNDGPSIREAIKFFARDHPDAKYAQCLIDPSVDELFTQRDKIEDFYDIYIESPCDYYIDKLGFDLFMPAMYESEMLLDNEFKDKDQVVADLDYYIGRIGFRFCHHLLDQRIPMMKKLTSSLNIPQ